MAKKSQLTPKTFSPKRMTYTHKTRHSATHTHTHTHTGNHKGTNACSFTGLLSHTLRWPGICDSARPTGRQSSEDGWYHLQVLHTAKNVGPERFNATLISLSVGCDSFKVHFKRILTLQRVICHCILNITPVSNWLWSNSFVAWLHCMKLRSNSTAMFHEVSSVSVSQKRQVSSKIWSFY